MSLGLHSLLFPTNSGLQDVGPWREQDAEATKATAADMACDLARMTPFTQGFFASQNRMTSFTWPNRLGGSSCSATHHGHQRYCNQ